MDLLRAYSPSESPGLLGRRQPDKQWPQLNHGHGGIQRFYSFYLLSSYLLIVPWVTDSKSKSQIACRLINAEQDSLPSVPCPRAAKSRPRSQAPARENLSPDTVLHFRTDRYPVDAGGNRRWSSKEAVLRPSSSHPTVPPCLPTIGVSHTTHHFANLVAVLPVFANVAILPHPLSNPPVGAGEIPYPVLPRRRGAPVPHQAGSLSHLLFL